VGAGTIGTGAGVVGASGIGGGVGSGRAGVTGATVAVSKLGTGVGIGVSGPSVGPDGRPMAEGIGVPDEPPVGLSGIGGSGVGCGVGSGVGAGVGSGVGSGVRGPMVGPEGLG